MIVKIAGFDAGFKFNNYAFEHLSLMKGADTFSSIGIAMIYCAYKGWCFVRQIDEQLTFENINDWIESGENEDVVKQLIDEFEASALWIRMKENLKKNAEQLSAA